MNRSWQDLFDVDRPPVVGDPSTLRSCADDVRHRIEQVLGVVRDLASSFGQPVDGFSGLAAETFDVLVTDLRAALSAAVGPLASIEDAARRHADRLEQLTLDASRALAEANRRVERRDELVLQRSSALRDVRDAEIEWSLVPLLEPGTVLVQQEEHRSAVARVAALERDLEAAEDEVARSLSAYDALRDEESICNTDFAGALDLGQLVDHHRGLSPALDGSFDGTSSVWTEVYQVLLGVGVDVALPSPAAAASLDQLDAALCAMAAEDGDIVLAVDGPNGGEFVVGVDIRPEIYAVAQELLAGRLPSFRPFGDVHDLSPSEFATVNWAYGSNLNLLEGPQLQMAGVNGQWDNYLSGGAYTPQPILPIDGMSLAALSGPDAPLAAVAVMGVAAVTADVRTMGSGPCRPPRRIRNRSRRGG